MTDRLRTTKEEERTDRGVFEVNFPDQNGCLESARQGFSKALHLACNSVISVQ